MWIGKERKAFEMLSELCTNQKNDAEFRKVITNKSGLTLANRAIDWAQNTLLKRFIDDAAKNTDLDNQLEKIIEILYKCLRTTRGSNFDKYVYRRKGSSDKQRLKRLSGAKAYLLALSKKDKTVVIDDGDREIDDDDKKARHKKDRTTADKWNNGTDLDRMKIFTALLLYTFLKKGDTSTASTNITKSVPAPAPVPKPEPTEQAKTQAKTQAKPRPKPRPKSKPQTEEELVAELDAALADILSPKDQEPIPTGGELALGWKIEKKSEADDWIEEIPEHAVRCNRHRGNVITSVLRSCQYMRVGKIKIEIKSRDKSAIPGDKEQYGGLLALCLNNECKIVKAVFGYYINSMGPLAIRRIINWTKEQSNKDESERHQYFKDLKRTGHGIIVTGDDCEKIAKLIDEEEKAKEKAKEEEEQKKLDEVLKGARKEAKQSGKKPCGRKATDSPADKGATKALPAVPKAHAKMEELKISGQIIFRGGDKAKGGEISGQIRALYDSGGKLTKKAKATIEKMGLPKVIAESQVDEDISSFTGVKSKITPAFLKEVEGAVAASDALHRERIEPRRYGCGYIPGNQLLTLYTKKLGPALAKKVYHMVQLASQTNGLESDTTEHTPLYEQWKDGTQGPTSASQSMSSWLMREKMYYDGELPDSAAAILEKLENAGVIEAMKFGDGDDLFAYFPTDKYMSDKCKEHYKDKDKYTRCLALFYRNGYIQAGTLNKEGRKEFVKILQDTSSHYMSQAAIADYCEEPTPFTQVFSAAISYQDVKPEDPDDSLEAMLNFLWMYPQYLNAIRDAMRKATQMPDRIIMLHLVQVGQGAFGNPKGLPYLCLQVALHKYDEALKDSNIVICQEWLQANAKGLLDLNEHLADYLRDDTTLHGEAIADLRAYAKAKGWSI